MSTWRAQIDDRGVIARYKNNDSGEVISAQEYERRLQMQPSGYGLPYGQAPGITAGLSPYAQPMPTAVSPYSQVMPQAVPVQTTPGSVASLGDGYPTQTPRGIQLPETGTDYSGSPLIQPGAQLLGGSGMPQQAVIPPAQTMPSQLTDGTGLVPPALGPGQGMPPTAGMPIQGKSLRLEGVQRQFSTQLGTQLSTQLSTQSSTQPSTQSTSRRPHGFLDATSIAVLLPTLVLLALIIAAAHKKRLFPWQTIRTFNPPSGLMNPRDYERSFLCPPNLRRHGRLGKRDPNATWSDADGVVLPFGFLARTHLPVTIPLGRLPNKNMFMVAPSGSGKTTLMRAIIKAMLAKPCVIVALEAKANDPNLDEKREGFKYSLVPEAQQAGFDTLYFNPLDTESVHWNPLELDPISFASSIVQDVNTLEPEDQHWAERDHGYIAGLVQLLKWGAIQVAGEDENGVAAEVIPLPCNPRGLMRLVNNRRNIVESLRRLKNNPDVDASTLGELTQTLSSIIRTDTDWDKNIQGVRGRLRMFKNPNILRATERSNIDMQAAMHRPTVLIFGAPASLGPDAESLASCFVYQLQQALHTRYGTASVLPLFAFFDEYQILNIDLAGRLSAIVRGANGGLTVILQNISQIASMPGGGRDFGGSGTSELRTIFSNAAIRVCLHNADESTARFFSEEIGKHAVIVPGVSDHYQAAGFGIFPSSWNRIHSQQVVPRVDPDSIKRMEKHHGLVYLSPAGDPEFGEVKPLMVDLRGIEEIARLHLLYNVSARRTPPEGGPDLASGPGGGPLRPSGEEGGTHPGQSASAGKGRLCPHCGNNAGKGKFCIECGQLVGLEQEKSAHAGSELVAAAAQHAQPAPQPASPPFPSFAQSSLPQFGDTRAGVAVKPNLFRSPHEIAEAAQESLGGGSYQQTGGVAEVPSPPEPKPRKPVTSFNPDMSKLGFTEQSQTHANKPNPGSVEF